MKKWWIGWIVLAVLILLYLFYPLCGFKRFGSSYKDDCNTCYCDIKGSACTLLGCDEKITPEEVILKLCKNITEENQYLSKCGNGIYTIETIFGEGRRISYYDSQGKFIENAIREDVPIFVTNSGKKTHCITDSGEECPDYSCSRLEC